jgi:uncharacterized Ntn-hydrolase superfamily protein
MAPGAIELMRTCACAAPALARLLAEDPATAVRQLAMIDAVGAVDVHTGHTCLPVRG